MKNTYQPYVKIGFLTWVLLGLGLGQVQAQQVSGGREIWTLDACIEYAIQNNLTVKQNDLQVQISENNYLQSKIERYPDLNGNASQTFSWGRAIDPTSNDFVNQQINSNRFSLSSNMTIFNGQSITNTIKRNKLNIEVDRKNAQQSRYDVSLNVAINYLNILLNKELLDVAQKNVESTQQQLDRTQKLFDAGAVAENDVIDLKATLANNELAVVTARNTLNLSIIGLQQSMNYDIDPDFNIEDVPIESLEVQPIAEAPAAIYREALLTQPNVKGAEINIESAAYDVDIARSGRYPTLTLNGSITSNFSDAARQVDFVTTGLEIQEIGVVEGTGQAVTSEVPVTERQVNDYPFFDQLSDNRFQQLTLNLSIPIFNRWAVKSNIQNSLIRQRIAETNSQNVKLQLRQTIEQAYADALAAYETFRSREQQVAALELSFETTEKRYLAGAANIVDYNLARINRDNARSDMVRAKYDYLFRQKVIDFYIGRPLSIK